MHARPAHIERIHQIIRIASMTLLMSLPLSTAAAKKAQTKPQDLDAMWQIIEKQQKQIEELKRKV